ncbi:MAG: TIM-barrel domain-containing protein [Bacteroidota bacterium]
MENNEQTPEQPISNEFALGTNRFPDVYFEKSPDQVKTITQDGDSVVFTSANGMRMKAQLVSDKIIRFRYTYSGVFERDFSYVLAENADFKLSAKELVQQRSENVLSTTDLQVYISNTDLRLKIYTEDGQLISEDAKPFYQYSTILKGTTSIQLTKKAPKGELFYGLGDKSGALNLRGQKLQNWNTDAFGFSAESDPLYRSIPFYYGLIDGIAYGIFFHNTHRSYFDFDSERIQELTFGATNGELDYFFIYGPTLLEVAQQYMQLTGVPELPPLWALGYHQCRWSYYPESRVRELAADFRKHQIPCDAIYLDIDYMDGYRCFTWDSELFPQPTKLIDDLAAEGFQTIVMIDPGIKVDPEYHVYKEGTEKDMFCRRFSGEMMIGPVWPAACVFPDYTKPEVREWWKGLYYDLYVENGVSGFWNDMNEPAVFKVNHMTFPNEVRHDMDGEQGDHARAHNIYGMQMSRATYEGLKVQKPNKRPFLLTRATFSGGQRYAAIWTGDNFATWEHLRLANIQCQRLSISGFSFVGTDIGGFAGDPTGELLVRWLQLGIFHPLFRVHSMGSNVDGASEVDADTVRMTELFDRRDQEPWSFGEENTALARKAIEFRYQLLPYLYTAFWRMIQFGHPVIKSLAFYDQTDPRMHEREQEFIFGEDLLVVPILRENCKEQALYLPKGEWYDYYAGTKHSGGDLVLAQVTPDKVPLYAKAGSIIPLYPIQQYVGEKAIETVDLNCFVGNGTSHIYQDAGEGYQYLKEAYSLRTLTSALHRGTYTIHQTEEGQFKGSLKNFKLSIIGLGALPSQLNVDGKIINYTVEDKQIKLTVPADFKELNIQFN